MMRVCGRGVALIRSAQARLKDKKAHSAKKVNRGNVRDF